MLKRKRALLDPNYSSIIDVSDIEHGTGPGTIKHYVIDRFTKKCILQQNDTNFRFALDHNAAMDPTTLSPLLIEENRSESVSEDPSTKKRESESNTDSLTVEDEIETVSEDPSTKKRESESNTNSCLTVEDEIEAVSEPPSTEKSHDTKSTTTETVQDQSLVNIPAVEETKAEAVLTENSNIIINKQNADASEWKPQSRLEPVLNEEPDIQHNLKIKTGMKSHMTRFVAIKRVLPPVKIQFDTDLVNTTPEAEGHRTHTHNLKYSNLPPRPSRKQQLVKEGWVAIQYDKHQQLVMDPLTRKLITKKKLERLRQLAAIGAKVEINKFVNTASLQELENEFGATAALKIYESRPISNMSLAKISYEGKRKWEWKHMMEKEKRSGNIRRKKKMGVKTYEQ